MNHIPGTPNFVKNVKILETQITFLCVRVRLTFDYAGSRTQGPSRAVQPLCHGATASAYLTGFFFLITFI